MSYETARAGAIREGLINFKGFRPSVVLSKKDKLRNTRKNTVIRGY